MTLLTICTNAAQLAPVSAPASIVGNSEQTATLLLALANMAGQALARRPQGGWVSQIREYDFTTNAIAAQGGSIANSGSGAVISGLLDTTDIVAGAWIATGTGVPSNAVVTAVTSTTVTINQNATAIGGGSYTFGQSDYVLPSDFQRSVDNTFWDRTNYWAMRGPQSPQQWQVYKSGVIGNTSIQRRYRFRYISGATRLSIDPLPLTAGAELVFEYVSNAWCESAAGVGQSQWLADTDVGVLDEYLLTLGVQWRLLRRLGLTYSEELAEYEREVDKAVAVDGGSTILDLTPVSVLGLLGPWSIPESGFGNGGSGGGSDSAFFTIGESAIGGTDGLA